MSLCQGKNFVVKKHHPLDYFFTKQHDFRLVQIVSICRQHINSLPNNKILDWPKLKAFAEDNLDITKEMISLYDLVENIVGKGENAGCQHFLLFQQCVPKLLPQGLKSLDYMVNS